MKIWTLTTYIKDEMLTCEHSIDVKNFVSKDIAQQAFSKEIEKIEKLILEQSGAETIGQLIEIDGDCCTYRKRETIFECYFEGICSCEVILTEEELIEEIEENKEENKFNIVIREVLEQVIEIEAPNRQEAIEMVQNLYNNEEIVLTADDFQGVEIF